MWAEYTNIKNNLSPSNNGIIRLWQPTNYTDSSGWTTDGNFDNNLWNYFFIPAGFLYVSKNTFAYNFPFKFINKSETVTGYVNHNGQHYLNEGKTASFWHLQAANKVNVNLLTDKSTKLPYLLTPNVGEPNYKGEVRYFIPCNVEF